VSAEILRLSDYRMDDGADGGIDLATAVDVAIRDLREILLCWGSDYEIARQRAEVRVDVAACLFRICH